MPSDKPHINGQFAETRPSEGFPGEKDVDTGPDGQESLPLHALMFKAHRKAPRPRASLKELHETLAFFRKTEGVFGRRSTVVDVCGAQGLLAMLFLAYRKAARAFVLDKDKRPALWNVWDAWQSFLPAGTPSDTDASSHAGDDCCSASGEGVRSDAGARSNADDRHEHGGLTPSRRAPRPGEEGCPLECVWGDLRNELSPLLGRLPWDTLVLACHACSHLTDIILDICAAKGVDFAVMPCCHKDRDGHQVTVAAASLGIPMAAAMDLVRFGRMQQLGYTVRWRTIDPAITPHNRILCGLIAGGGKASQASLSIPAGKDAKGITHKRPERVKKSSCSTDVYSTPNEACLK